MKDLRQITVIGLGLLGGSVILTVLRCFPRVKVVGYSHRAVTRKKARELIIGCEVVDDIAVSVCGADLVILSTPIYTFEDIFSTMRDALPKGCIVTDVGSTKVLPHRWAAKRLGRDVHYVGSHPIAGSEQRGIEFARDDLFEQTLCVLTATKKTNRRAVGMLKRFWSGIGCAVKEMTPAEHDKVFASISHLPHMTAVALVNVTGDNDIKYAGKGFIDTTRIASGPANIWADVLLSNAKNTSRDINKFIVELEKLEKAIRSGNQKQIEKLLEKAGSKRAALINYKIKKKEMIL